MKQKCPVCHKESVPVCPFYDECKYRKGSLCPLGVCWRKPEMCTYYSTRTRLELPKTPSSRTFGVDQNDKNKDIQKV